MDNEKKEKYRKTDTYKKSIEFVKQFIDEVFKGDIQQLKEYCFDDLNKDRCYKKYVCKDGLGTQDPDNMAIVRAIYICLWGDIFDIVISDDDTENAIGVWGNRLKSRHFPFRGDTINSFNNIFGRDKQVVLKYNFDQNLKRKIDSFQKKYHTIGNFIVLPNRGNVNSKRGNPNFMQDYFDWFLIAIYNYQQHQNNSKDRLIEEFYNINVEASKNFECVLNKNHEYAKWNETMIKRLYLELFYKNGIPYNYFQISIMDRMKGHEGRRPRKKYGIISEKEYRKLVEAYLDNAENIINARTDEIIKQIEKELDSFKVL